MKNKNKLTSYKLYAAWEYEKEERELNEASRKGLQLVKGGCFHSKFRKDDSVRYIYQLDYNTKIDDRSRYYEAFEEQGWDYVNSTYNGWHYFRKPYKEDMDESESRIYTDKQSLYEMQNRWIRLITMLDIFYVIMAFVYITMGIHEREFSILTEGIIFLMLGVTFALGIRNVKSKREGGNSGVSIPVQIVLPLSILILVLVFTFKVFGDSYKVYEENFTFIKMEEEKLPQSSKEFNIKKAGNYSLDLDFNAGDGMLTVSIVNNKGKEFYKNTADRSKVDNWSLQLEKGTYHAIYQYDYDNYDSNKAEISVDLKITE